MELGAIITALETYKTGPFPRDAVEQAIARPDEITPLTVGSVRRRQNQHTRDLRQT